MKPMQWHVKGVHPNARDSAREAARRAGMSVGEWLNSVILDSADDHEHDSYGYEDHYAPPLQPRSRYPEPRERDYERRYEPRYSRDPVSEEVASIHGRLESLTEGVENLMRSTSASRGHWPEHDNTSRRLADAIAKLDQRVDHLIQEGRTTSRAIERRVESVDRALSALSRSRSIGGGSWTPGIDQTVAEIAMRQRELDGDPGFGRTRGPAYDARVREELARHDFAGVDDKLRYITEQIDTLGPGRMNDAIAGLRNDLAEIARTLTEASPRRAIEALEGEVRVLASRLDSRNRSGTGTPALATLEKGLTEVRDALRGLTPAENLAGAVDAIHALSQKIDQMATGRQDPAAMQQLETAIAGLRSIASHAASNEAVTTLTAEVHALADRIDSGGSAVTQNNDTLKTLETRIGMIADAIEQVRASGGRSSSPDIDAMVRTLGDKIERLQGGETSGIGQLDSRITSLVQKLEASESRLGSLDAIERGMKELLGYITELRGGNAPPMANSVAAPAIVKDVRRTEQSLEAVHDTIGDVVDRLAMIETGMRGSNPDRPAAPVSAPAAAPARTAAQAEPAPPLVPSQQPQRTAAPAHSIPHAQPAAAAASYSMQPQPRPEMPRAAPMQTPVQPAPPQPRVAVAQQVRPAADGTLPYDFPLEPGSGKPRPGMATPATGSSNGSAVSAFRTPAERIATSKASLEPTTAAASDDAQPKSNFIEAARRAAQFAAETQTTPGSPNFKHAPDVEPAPVSLSARMRKHAKSVLVGASVLILLAAAIHTAVNFFGLNEQAVEPVAPKPQSKLIAPDSLAKLTPQSNTVASGAAGELSLPKDPFSIASGDVQPQAVVQTSAPPQIPAPKTIQVPERFASAGPVSSAPAPEITGAVPTRLVPPPAGLFNSAQPRVAALPPSIGGRALVASAESGDPAAAFEVAVRYSEGRGVTVSLEEAAVWFERAARLGLTPAMFRLGGLYEKGIGVKKDLRRAQALYITAAERGSAKAMHNLAVLYAEGVDAKPDYPNALAWFRKAADRGVADSQFNLGVLYARGIGMEANLAESYKWFALAANGGDRDAAQKRDDVGKRLDPQTLKAVQASVQKWTPEPQPDDAVSVRAPAGGWDQAGPQTPAKANPKTNAKRVQGAPAGAKSL